MITRDDVIALQDARNEAYDDLDRARRVVVGWRSQAAYGLNHAGSGDGDLAELEDARQRYEEAVARCDAAKAAYRRWEGA